MKDATGFVEALGCLSPLCDLGKASLLDVVALAQREVFPKSLQPLSFDWDQKVVYLLRGELKLGYPEGGTRVLVGGSGTALAPIGRAGQSPCNVRAITDVELIWFDENALDILVTWDQLMPVVATADNSASAEWRIMSGMFDIRKLAGGTFANLPPANIERLLTCFQRQSVKCGDVIVRQNDPGDYYYVIECGRAVVTREVAGAIIDLAELGAGDTFGEEALVAETVRNATVTMHSDGELLRLDGADFVKLLREPLLHRIDADEARQRIAAGAVWLDVRFPAECRHDGMPGAINVPLNELRNTLPSLHKGNEYIAYCQTGRRSSVAAFLLSQHGLQAALLSGGLKTMNNAMERVAE